MAQTAAEPLTRKEGQARADWPEWWQAELKEIHALEELGCWEYVPKSAVPAGNRIYHCKWVYKQKPDRKKGRICVLAWQYAITM